MADRNGRRVRARAHLRAEVDDRGVTVVTALRSDPPLLLRATGAVVHLVGGAAGPLGGDDLVLEVIVGTGAELTVRSAAASLALPGPFGSQSQMRTEIEVGAAARLDWRIEPLVTVVGSDHVAATSVELAGSARMVFNDVIVLGRHAEGPGDLESRIDVVRAGVPVLRHHTGYGRRWPGWDGPGGVAGYRVVATKLEVGESVRCSSSPAQTGAGRACGAVMPLGDGVTLTLALAEHHHELVGDRSRSAETGRVQADVIDRPPSADRHATAPA